MTTWLTRTGCGLLVLAALVAGYAVADRAGPTTKVVVASRALSRFATVAAHDVMTTRRPVGDVPADAITDPHDALGQVVLAAVATDGIVRKGNLVKADAISGRVAITLTTSASRAPGSGTTTDVVVSPRKSGTRGRVYSRLLVLASEKDGTTVRVTLAVDPAERDALADVVGSSDVTLAPEITP